GVHQSPKGKARYQLCRIATVSRFLRASRAKQGCGGRRSLISAGLGTIRTGVCTKRDRDLMTLAGIVIIYVVFCILTRLSGSQRRMGFFGTFMMSLFITPIVMLILLKLTAPSERVELGHPSQSDQLLLVQRRQSLCAPVDGPTRAKGLDRTVFFFEARPP